MGYLASEHRLARFEITNPLKKVGVSVCVCKKKTHFPQGKRALLHMVVQRDMFLLSQALTVRKKRTHMDLIMILLVLIVFGIGILMLPKAPKKKEKHYVLVEVEVEDKK